MSLFDLSRASVLSAQRNLSALSGLQKSATLGRLASGGLGDYYLLHSTRGELLRRLGRPAESAAEFARARDLATNDVERTYLERRRVEVQGSAGSASLS